MVHPKDISEIATNALKRAQGVFEKYAKLHGAKQPPDTVKALANKVEGTLCELAIAQVADLTSRLIDEPVLRMTGAPDSDGGPGTMYLGDRPFEIDKAGFMKFSKPDDHEQLRALIHQAKMSSPSHATEYLAHAHVLIKKIIAERPADATVDQDVAVWVNAHINVVGNDSDRRMFVKLLQQIRQRRVEPYVGELWAIQNQLATVHEELGTIEKNAPAEEAKKLANLREMLINAKKNVRKVLGEKF